MPTYMKVYCPICKSEMDGMRAYGRESRCCGKVCHEEWEWRRALAVMGEQYRPKAKPEEVNRVGNVEDLE